MKKNLCKLCFAGFSVFCFPSVVNAAVEVGTYDEFVKAVSTQAADVEIVLTADIEAPNALTVSPESFSWRYDSDGDGKQDSDRKSFTIDGQGHTLNVNTSLVVVEGSYFMKNLNIPQSLSFSLSGATNTVIDNCELRSIGINDGNVELYNSTLYDGWGVQANDKNGKILYGEGNKGYIRVPDPVMMDYTTRYDEKTGKLVFKGITKPNLRVVLLDNATSPQSVLVDGVYSDENGNFEISYKIDIDEWAHFNKEFDFAIFDDTEVGKSYLVKNPINTKSSGLPYCYQDIYVQNVDPDCEIDLNSFIYYYTTEKYGKISLSDLKMGVNRLQVGSTIVDLNVKNFVKELPTIKYDKVVCEYEHFHFTYEDNEFSTGKEFCTFVGNPSGEHGDCGKDQDFQIRPGDKGLRLKVNTRTKFCPNVYSDLDLTVKPYRSISFKEDYSCHRSIAVSPSSSKEFLTKEDGRLVLYKMSGGKVVAKSEKYYDLPDDGVFDISTLANGEYRLQFAPSDDVCAEETYIDFKVNNPIPVSMSVGVDSHCEEADGGQDFVIKNWNTYLNGSLYKIEGTPSETTKDGEFIPSDNETLIAENIRPSKAVTQEDKSVTAEYNIRGLGKGTYRFVVSNSCQTWMNRVFNVDVKFEDLLLAIFSIDDCNNFISVKGTEFSDGDYYLIQKVNGEEDPSSAKLLNWTNPEKVVDVKSLASGNYTVKFVPSADNVCSKVSQLDFTVSSPEMSSQVSVSPSKCGESEGSISFSVKNWLTGYHGALYSVDQDFASGTKGKETLLKAIEPVNRVYNSEEGSFTANFKQEGLDAGLYRFSLTDDCGEELLSEFFSIEGNDEKSPVIEESISKVGDNAFMVSILVSDYNPNTTFSYLVQDECNRVDKKMDIDKLLSEITSTPSPGVVNNSGLSLSCLNNPVAKGEAAEVIVSMPEEDDFTYTVYDANGAVVVPETANKATASFSGNGVNYPVIVKNVNQVLIVRVQTKTDSKSILIIPE
ncbi:MAG: hypothetical protein J6I79_05825 [Paludibacteraceae bacterium]|nr:hypothetical protein [Paludibacteraceae bacterium]